MSVYDYKSKSSLAGEENSKSGPALGPLSEPLLLENNVQVLLNRFLGLHSFGASVAVNYGSLFEVPAINGSAHFLEHMLFKGTKKRTWKEESALVESSGMEWNATTTKELTNFYFSGRPNTLPLAIDILADRIKNATLPPDELESERGPVTNEIRADTDDPEWAAHIGLEKALFSDVLCVDTVGTEDAMSKISRDKLFDIYQRNYTPDNIIISVYGKFSYEKALNLVKENFGDFDRQYGGMSPSLGFTYPKAGDHVSESNGITSPISFMGFRLPGVREINDKDDSLWPSVETLTYVLDDYTTDTLINELRLATEAGVWTEYNKNLGGLFLYMRTNDSKLESTRDLIVKKLDSIILGETSEEELKACTRRMNIHDERHLDNSSRMARALARNQMLYGRNSILTSPVNRESIMKYAELYLNPKYLVSFSLVPKKQEQISCS